MASEAYQEQKHLLSRDEVAEHASLAVARSVRADLPHVAGWRGGALAKRATCIYDLNGTALFHDFAVSRGRTKLGTVRMSASKVLGAPAFAYEIGPRRWSYAAAVKALKSRLARTHRASRVTSTKLVCYSYPKIGVLVNMQDRSRRRSRLIFDIASLKQIPEGDPSSEREGAYAWSYYDALDDKARKARLKRFAAVDAPRLQLSTAKRRMVRRLDIDKLVAKKEFYPLKSKIVRELQFCSHYLASEERSHHCFVLHAQEVDDYCAVATCQMVLCYYRYYHDQDDIAPACSYTAGSGCPADSSAGYETMSNDHLEATYDPSETWAEAKAELDKLHPMKSGIPGHARACAGYAYTRFATSLAITERQLLIYDPWPWNADLKLGGAVYWEDWDSVTHTNFIYTKLKT